MIEQLFQTFERHPTVSLIGLGLFIILLEAICDTIKSFNKKEDEE